MKFKVGDRIMYVSNGQKWRGTVINGDEVLIDIAPPGFESNVGERLSHRTCDWQIDYSPEAEAIPPTEPAPQPTPWTEARKFCEAMSSLPLPLDYAWPAPHLDDAMIENAAPPSPEAEAERFAEFRAIIDEYVSPKLPPGVTLTCDRVWFGNETNEAADFVCWAYAGGHELATMCCPGWVSDCCQDECDDFVAEVNAEWVRRARAEGSDR